MDTRGFLIMLECSARPRRKQENDPKTHYASEEDVSENKTTKELAVPPNFIKTIIDEDLQVGKHQQVVTRFPPEPNGYLHIGHAKSICLNFGLALDYDGQCHLRFDDTNPLKEDTEYVDSIKNDVAWLGFDWGEHLYFASDYFEQMYEFAITLIKKGKAYIDSQTIDEIREQRGTLGVPGSHSPHRERSVEENLDLFARMRAGEFEDGAHVLRAKADMSSPNMLMRDPVLYRIRHAHHHRTGDAWCIYPMYDFAHCLEDSIEGITHSICTLEFENNRELYDWLLDEIGTPCHPQQIEFARLSLDHTVMSKRKLLQLVEQGHVSGWDDPRMPTIAGLRRRGVTPAAIRQFAAMIGVAKANSMVDMGTLEFCIRDSLNHEAPRVMAVLDPIKVTITNYPEDKTEWLEGSYWPEDIPKEASRKLPFTRELYIERSDFMENPPKKFFRLAPGREVRLRYAYYLTCQEVVKDDAGEIVELLCTYDPESLGGTADGRKVKGTIHWVSATESVPATVRLYDRLFSHPQPDGDPEVDFLERMNKESLVTVSAFVEPSLGESAPGAHFQFERQGYFFSDPEEHATDGLVFNRVVSLKDSWAKLQKKSAPATPAPTKNEKKQQKAANTPSKSPTEERDRIREANPTLAARYASYKGELGLSKDNADILSGDVALSDFFDAALVEGVQPQSVANWVVNELMRELKDRALADLLFTPAQLGELVGLIDDETLSSKGAKTVFEIMLAEGKAPSVIVEEKGLKQITDPAQIAEFIDAVLNKHTKQVEQYRAGKTNLLGFFIGKVMGASRGKAEPNKTRALLAEKLEG